MWVLNVCSILLNLYEMYYNRKIKIDSPQNHNDDMKKKQKQNQQLQQQTHWMEMIS